MAKDYLRQSALAHLHLEALGVDDPSAVGEIGRASCRERV
jgi:hypothetical protein